MEGDEQTADLAELRPARRLEALAGQGVIGFEVAGAAQETWLLPEEVPFVAQAVNKRRLEFAGGRACARRALSALGVAEVPIAVGDKRAPVWPDGVVGSITHTDGYCGAVVARRERLAGLGIDVEQRGRVSADVETMIATDFERDWLAALPARERADRATVLFSAKEAFYKCQFAITRGWLGFQDVSLTIRDDEFDITVHADVPALAPFGRVFTGRFAMTEEHVLTAVVIPSSGVRRE